MASHTASIMHGKKNAGIPSQQKAEHTTDWITIVGRVASLLSIIMYVSYIPQIISNVSGNPGVPWQPLAAMFNCILWSAYGFFKQKRDWPIVAANVPGIFLAGAAFFTSIIHF